MIIIRSLCVVFLIFVILSALVLSEQVLVRDFCNDISEKLDSICRELTQGNIPRDNVSSVVALWENKKSIAFIFFNHSDFKEIESNICRLEFYSGKGDVENSEFCVDTLRHRVHELKESCGFKKENIL